jgi:hypothetical protein
MPLGISSYITPIYYLHVNGNIKEIIWYAKALKSEINFIMLYAYVQQCCIIKLI